MPLCVMWFQPLLLATLGVSSAALATQSTLRVFTADGSIVEARESAPKASQDLKSTRGSTEEAEIQADGQISSFLEPAGLNSSDAERLSSSPVAQVPGATATNTSAVKRQHTTKAIHPADASLLAVATGRANRLLQPIEKLHREMPKAMALLARGSSTSELKGDVLGMSGLAIGLILAGALALAVACVCLPRMGSYSLAPVQVEQHKQQAQPLAGPGSGSRTPVGPRRVEDINAERARRQAEQDRMHDWAFQEGHRFSQYGEVGQGVTLKHNSLVRTAHLYSSGLDRPPLLDGERLSDRALARTQDGLVIALHGNFKNTPQEGAGVITIPRENNVRVGSVTMSEVHAENGGGILIEAADYGAHLKPLAFLDTFMAFHHLRHQLEHPYVLIHKTSGEEESVFETVGTRDLRGARPGAEGPATDPLRVGALPVYATVSPDRGAVGRYIVRRKTLDGPIMLISMYDMNGFRFQDSYQRLVGRAEPQGDGQGFLIHVGVDMDTALMVAVTLALVKLGPGQ